MLGVVGEERFEILKLGQLVEGFVILLTCGFKGCVGCVKSRSSFCFQ